MLRKTFTSPSLDNKPYLKIGITAAIPHIFPCTLDYGLLPTLQCKRPGSDAECLGAILRHARIPYELYEYYNNTKDPYIIDYNNTTQSFTGIFDHIYRGELDIAALTMQYERVVIDHL